MQPHHNPPPAFYPPAGYPGVAFPAFQQHPPPNFPQLHPNPFFPHNFHQEDFVVFPPQIHYDVPFGHPVHQPIFPQQIVFPPVVPQQPVVPVPQPKPDPVSSMTDSILALKLQDEERKNFHAAKENAQNQELKDAQLAKQLQEIETKKDQEAKRQEQEDKKLALQFLLEEKEAEKLRLENEKVEALRKDQELAKKMQEEEQMKLATLEAHAKMAQHKPKANAAAAHANHIHAIWCKCSKTTTIHNNHIYKVHDRFCQCGTYYWKKPTPNYNNQGRVHEHNYTCCSLNHIHTKGCYCTYENHRHTYSCCPYDHVHTKYCHCTAK